MASVGLNLNSLENALAVGEGFGVPGAVPTLANNPGDLELGNIGYGTTAAAGGNQITNFPTAQSGWDALTRQLQSIFTGASKYYNPNQTLEQVCGIYGCNANTVANLIGGGTTPQTTLSSLMSSGKIFVPSFGVGPNVAVTPQAVGDTLQRGISIVLGLIFIVAGLLMFRQTQVVIQSVGRTASAAAELAA